jgi:hypothetical protein
MVLAAECAESAEEDGFRPPPEIVDVR